MTNNDPTEPFTEYFTSPEHPARPGRALYYVDHSQRRGIHFNQVSFTTRHISELLSSYAASNDVRQELDREIQDLRRRLEQAGHRNRQFCSEIDELQAQLREQQLTPTHEDTGELAEATAQLAEFMTFWELANPTAGNGNIQSLWCSEPGERAGEGHYVTLPASALRIILAELQRRQPPEPEDTATDPLAPPVPPPPGPDFKAMADELAALFNRLAANLPGQL